MGVWLHSNFRRQTHLLLSWLGHLLQVCVHHLGHSRCVKMVAGASSRLVTEGVLLVVVDNSMLILEVFLSDGSLLHCWRCWHLEQDSARVMRVLSSQIWCVTSSTVEEEIFLAFVVIKLWVEACLINYKAISMLAVTCRDILSLLRRCLIVAEKMVLGHQVRLWAALLILYKFGVPLSCLMVLGKNLRRLIVCLLSYLINVFYVYSLNLSGRNRRRIGRKSLVDDTWLRAVVELPCNDFPTRALAP